MAIALLRSSPASNSTPHFPATPSPTIFGSTQVRFLGTQQTQLGLLQNSFRRHPALRLMASREGPGAIQERTKPSNTKETPNGSDSFTEMKDRFLSFKRHKYMENLECYQKLSTGQAPKFMVISCADSRVCPSYILGFQPGEAFVVRNIANLVPPFEGGACETSAALEFSVNNLQVENILVTGHSCCGGIRALMSMEDGVISSSFITSWVANGKDARSGTKAVASKLSFDQQCRHCEKESVNRSLLNLLSYPWIEERVSEGLLSLHGGYYDFVDCTYEKWTLDYQRGSSKQESVKKVETWLGFISCSRMNECSTVDPEGRQSVQPLILKECKASVDTMGGHALYIGMMGAVASSADKNLENCLS